MRNPVKQVPLNLITPQINRHLMGGFPFQTWQPNPGSRTIRMCLCSSIVIENSQSCVKKKKINLSPCLQSQTMGPSCVIIPPFPSPLSDIIFIDKWYNASGYLWPFPLKKMKAPCRAFWFLFFPRLIALFHVSLRGSERRDAVLFIFRSLAHKAANLPFHSFKGNPKCHPLERLLSIKFPQMSRRAKRALPINNFSKKRSAFKNKIHVCFKRFQKVVFTS